MSNTCKIFIEKKIRSVQYDIKLLGYIAGYCFVLQAPYKVICVSVIFTSYLLISHMLLILTKNAILAKAEVQYTYVGKMY